MPNVTMEVSPGPDSTPDIYVEGSDGFAISAGQVPSLPGVIPNGLTIGLDGGVNGAYLRTTNSNDLVFLEGTTAGKPFGLLSIDLEGFVNAATGSGVVRGEGVPVTFHFVAFLQNSAVPLEFDLTTNDALDFETFSVGAADPEHRLPAELANGVVLIQWQAIGGTNVWGAFDNLVLTSNSAPVAAATTSSTDAEGGLSGQLGAFDPDGDTLTFAGFLPVGGEPTPGVTINPDGSFSVERTEADDDLLPGEFRDVTFQYTVTDGFEITGPITVTVQMGGLPQGPDIRLGNHPQDKDGTSAGERMFGGNSGDTLCGLGGADSLWGENGTDFLCGDDGRDRLDGGNGSDTLLGGAGNDKLYGGNSPDRLVGGSGDDTMTGGQSPDFFVFGTGWGDDRITDFDPKNEVIQFGISPTFGSWGDFLHLKQIGLIHQDGKDTVIEDGQGNSLILENVKLSSLREDDFIFG